MQIPSKQGGTWQISADSGRPLAWEAIHSSYDFGGEAPLFHQRASAPTLEELYVEIESVDEDALETARIEGALPATKGEWRPIVQGKGTPTERVTGWLEVFRTAGGERVSIPGASRYLAHPAPVQPDLRDLDGLSAAEVAAYELEDLHYTEGR